MIRYFNAKSKDWYSTDITCFEGSELDFVTSQFGLSQITKEPTHILDISRSYVDLTFICQPNMLIDSGLHASFCVLEISPPNHIRKVRFKDILSATI